MTLDILDKDSTLIKIKESGWKENHESLDKYYSHCKAWSANAMWPESLCGVSEELKIIFLLNWLKHSVSESSAQLRKDDTSTDSAI